MDGCFSTRGIGFGISTKGAKTERPTGGFILPDDALISGAGAAPRDSAPKDRLDPVWHQTAKGYLVLGSGALFAAAWASRLVRPAESPGSDVALETADAAILRERVTDVAGQIRLARAMIGSIRQKIAIDLELKAGFLVATVLGVTGLWIAILAHTGVAVLVTLNALRLLPFRPTFAERLAEPGRCPTTHATDETTA
ncbi:Cd2+/Zn2+-exporting ATPase [Sulfitobacter dubius]|nr:Cd2+/Zn2+-exporting ATPase [Sulfitobacter dubius]